MNDVVICNPKVVTLIGSHGGNVTIGPRWISVKDKMPPIDEAVLVCTEEGCVFGGSFQKDSKREWWESHCACYFMDTVENVTHWMPLPYPPDSDHHAEP